MKCGRTREEEIARRNRWMAGGMAKVAHPNHGSVVVPCGSKLAALLCAAEFLGIEDERAFLREASCTQATEADGPLRVPKEFAALRRERKA